MSMHSLIRQLATLITVAILAGCGAEAPSMAPDAGKTSGNLLITQPGRGLDPGQTQPDPKAILQEIGRLYQQTTGLSAQITTYDSNGSKSVSSKAQAYFQKPAQISIQVLQHTDGKAVGTKIVHLGSGKAHIKTKFFGFQVKIDLDPSDSRICNLRGDTLLETGLVRMMQILLDPQAQVKILGQGTMNGSPMTMLEVVSRQSLRGITREVYGVDMNLKMPVIRELYQGTKLVYRSQFSNIVKNPQYPSNAFTLD